MTKSTFDTYVMLSTNFLDKTFVNPLILASGITTVNAQAMVNFVKNGAGGITVKSISKLPRQGHPPPITSRHDCFFINAVGLANPGIDKAIEELKKFKGLTDVSLFGSIFAGTSEEFGEIAEKICEAPIDFLEVDISCPNVSREFGDPFAYSIPAVEKITKAVKEKSKVPISLKLSPNAWNIADIAKAAEANGADAITAVNTISGLIIDIKKRQPILSNKIGGVSGPALFPIALKCVYDIYKAVKIPIIGTGGITTGEDALAMVMAGAALLGVGSAVYFRGPGAFKKIAQEMEEIMQKENIKSLEEIRGVAHFSS